MKRYALVGTGSRSAMFTHALLGDFKEHGSLVALCDINPVRLEYASRSLSQQFDIPPLPTYEPADLEKMLDEQAVDVLIVTTMDRTHHHYIIRAMEAGRDVITEKPMTIDERKCQDIFDAIDRTGRSLRVTFNYRYAPRNSRVKELLMDGVIGEIKSVHFEWLLDTKHGADYFRRWHRDKRNSGGLMVHKATHHFDLVNWWLDDSPEMVFALGDLVFYGRENAEQRGMTRFYDRGTGHPNAADDPFALDLSKDEETRRLYLEAEKADGYRRDESVFGHYISIEDDVSVLVRYRRGTTMSYHLTAYSPWEGYRIAFNGTEGRLEYEVSEKPYVSGTSQDVNQPVVRDSQELVIEEPVRIVLRRHWSKPMIVPFKPPAEGGHGGGDKRLLRDILVGDQEDPLHRSANHIAGAQSILTGIAANRSFATGQAVRVSDLFRLPG